VSHPPYDHSSIVSLLLNVYGCLKRHSTDHPLRAGQVPVSQMLKKSMYMPSGNPSIETHALIGFSATNTWDFPGDTYNIYRIRGEALPVDEEVENRIGYLATGSLVCGVVTEIYVISVTDGTTQRELLSYTCDQNSSLVIRPFQS
jgi:hypothetical protein